MTLKFRWMARGRGATGWQGERDEEEEEEDGEKEEAEQGRFLIWTNAGTGRMMICKHVGGLFMAA